MQPAANLRRNALSGYFGRVTTPGLRERKKERTRATITRVALELFARDGFAATTVTAIAEAAEVSPRTVSTYFPHKEGIVFSAYDASIRRLAARLARRQPQETVLAAVEAWIRGEEHESRDWSSPMVLPAREVDGVDFARLRATAIERDDTLWALQRRKLHEIEELIAGAARGDLGDELLARVLGAALVAALLELNALAARGEGGTLDSVDVLFGFLRAGLDAVAK
jgi:AcrR family transcriptional regulator